MEPAVDPFQPLLRLVDRYRQDVHHLRPTPLEGAVNEAEKHLGMRIPPCMAEFFARWDGAVLFRGALRVRSTSELAPVDPAWPHVIAFADGPRPEDRWVIVENPDGTPIYGRWNGVGVTPLHTRFHRWLGGMIAVMENDPREEAARLDLLLQCDPRSPFLLLWKAEEHLSQGDPDRALPLLRRATVEAPDMLPAWQRLGDVLGSSEAGEARFAFLKAIRSIRLPLPWPGARTADPDLVGSLERLFPPGDDAWERELLHVLTENVVDVHSAEELALVEALGLAFGRVFLARGQRVDARARLAELQERASSYRFTGLMGNLRLLLARLDTELGHHDDAEIRLRPLHLCADPQIRARARLALGRLVVTRQEPWAEEILDEAGQMLEDPRDRIQVSLLLAERHLILNHTDLALKELLAVQPLLTRTGGLDLYATWFLLQGDAARLGQDLEGARKAYGEAEERAVEMRDSELRLRLGLRAGDLAVAEGRSQAAADAFAQAAEGFKRLGLPLREGWALLRLARIGDVNALRRARQIFSEADLAAGVAAADAVEGDPSISLDWHLERATEHARMQAEAQRARPPLTRADADRPERRLGAHQMAIAACGPRVVEVLGEIALSTGRALDSLSSRAVDPRMARYLAAVDLLAHHKSYEASEVLLAHLFNDQLSAAAARALMGALARSPNYSLVSGLLDALDRSGRDSVAVSRAAEILGWRRQQEAAARLLTLAQPGCPTRVRLAAVMALGRVGCKEAIPTLHQALYEAELAETAGIALLLLGDREGVTFHAELLDGGDRTRGGSPGEIVGRYGDPSFLLILKATAMRGDETALGAIQGLGYLGDPHGVPTLIECTGHHDARIAAVAGGALEILTGHHEETEAPQLKNRWHRWWERAGDGLSPGVRHRFGQVMDPGLLISRLDDDLLAARQAAYDELVISTGVNLPFDADGAWRVQVHHREAWERWWRERRATFPRGRWTFHGRVTW